MIILLLRYNILIININIIIIKFINIDIYYKISENNS